MLTGQNIQTDAAQECHELMGMLSELIAELRAKAARGDDDAAALIETVRDTLYTELVTVLQIGG